MCTAIGRLFLERDGTPQTPNHASGALIKLELKSEQSKDISRDVPIE
jgi:hypothetical protein